MAVEIEKKYLVHHDKWHAFSKPDGVLYQQGYIVTDPAKTIRVRIADSKGFLTIKGANVGATRAEFEYEIPFNDAKELLTQFCSSVISKLRYRVPFMNKIWEVDEFLTDNVGLIIAEVELSQVNEAFTLPEWVSLEVTEDERYYNSNLSLHPFNAW